MTGHGLASALLSVSIMNVLRSRSLPNAEFRDPAQVLSGLNEAFPGEAYGDKFFTIWYGVYRRSTGTLSWSGGGHPPSLLFTGPSGGTPARLESDGIVMGMVPGAEFSASAVSVPAGSRLYVYTDGCHEIHLPSGGLWSFDEFAAFISQPVPPSTSIMDRLLDHVRRLSDTDVLLDDFSIVEATF